MPKKNKGSNVAADVKAKEIVTISLAQLIEDNMRRYGRMTVEDRAIPDYRDGMIPVQRRILYSMYMMYLWQSGGFVKSARVVGDVLGKYHPHGDLACYGSLVNMVNGVYPLINGQGNFGKWDGSPAAAMRYTECRLLGTTENLLLDKEYMAVTEMVPSYDGSHEEPIVLPAKLPMSLVLGCKMGIAVGTTTKIPSYTIESVSALILKAATEAAKTKAIPAVSVKQCIKTLEMSTELGGIITSTDAELAEIISTGIGRVTWQCEYVWDEKERAFIVNALAPGWTYGAGIKKLRALVGVSSVDNLSNKKLGIRILVRLQRSVTKGEVETALKKALTTAQMNYTNVTKRYKADVEGFKIGEAKFAKMGASDIVNEWLAWRHGLEKLAQANIIAGLQVKIATQQLMLKAIAHLDLIFALLKKRGTVDKVKELSKGMKITEEEAKQIWDLRVKLLDNLNVAVVNGEIAKLNAEVKVAKAYAANPATKIVEDMKALTKG